MGDMANWAMNNEIIEDVDVEDRWYSRDRNFKPKKKKKKDFSFERRNARRRKERERDND